MYWYYKYPLYLLAALAACGCLYLLYQNLPAGARFGSQPVPVEPVAAEPAVAAPAPPAVAAPTVPAPPRVEPAPLPTPVPAPPLPPLPTPPPGVAPATGAPASNEALEQKLKAAEEQLQQDNLIAARTLAQAVLDSQDAPLFSPLWLRAAQTVSTVSTTLINSDAPAPEKVRYVVQPKDTLIGIAGKYKTTVTAIERGNKMSAGHNDIYPGMVLTIYAGNWSILVSKTKFGLVLHDGQKVFKYYRVGIGRQNRTPVGVFRVNSRLREPVWTPPGKVIPFGDPRNVLGTRWLGIQPIEETDPSLKGFGIHGTWEPETVGTPASEGCIRLKNDDVNELYDIVPLGTRVVIKDE